jgi:RNA polymerase sigma-70 factor (ECF subfamily)
VSDPSGQRAATPADLYAGCYRRLVGVVALAAGSRAEAEDVVQEAFVRVLTCWTRIQGYDDPEAWVRQVAFRLLSNRRRRLRNAMLARARALPPAPVSSPGPDGIDIARAIAALPLGQRQVVVLHHLLDLGVDAVAAELHLPVGTVKSRLARARQSLAPMLREEVDDHA